MVSAANVTVSVVADDDVVAVAKFDIQLNGVVLLLLRLLLLLPL